ncbi:MAG: hypothetical protein JNL82_12075 [Myxococcales bacterium]|nr:hypothetical protein [Myxococcales bacterium]
MPRLPHGRSISTQQIKRARSALAAHSVPVDLAFSATAPVDLQRFDYLFVGLQSDPDNLLPEAAATRDDLVRLGKTMMEAAAVMDDPAGDSAIPAAYTYLGQFIDHDVTLEALSAALPDLTAPGLRPMALADARTLLRNARTASLDLDSVYGLPAPRSGDQMVLGTVSPTVNNNPPLARPPGKDDLNDLPREARSEDPEHDRAALIGDPRNDENTIISQLHVAFLRAHNAIVARGHGFDEAGVLLRQHYQHVVIHDFLRRIVDPALVDRILQYGNRFYDAMAEPFYLPLEFTVAAYRFGHTMVRGAYDFNLNFNRTRGGIPATLQLLFTFTAFSGQLGDFATLPHNWIVEWPELIGDGPEVEKTRRLDTRLVEPLFTLPQIDGQPEPGDRGRLAVRNLLRGYLLRMPTGQAVARALGVAPLTAAELEAVAASVPAAPGGESQLDVLRSAGFLERTPLWFYVLAEAASVGDGQRLGPVGGTIVAEVLIGLVRRSKDSILRTYGWRPTLPSARGDGHFDLSDLLRLAGVL